MNRHLRASTLRLVGGLLLLLGAGAVALFLLPDASQKRVQQGKAFNQAGAQLQHQEEELQKLKARAESIRIGRERMEEVLSHMPQENEGQLKWKLSRTLYDLASKHGVRILTVKYGAPTREGAKGTDLEALDVEFVASGIYKELKAFMHAFESSHLPFGLASGKLDETPEGARMTVSVRAFRRTGQVKGEAGGEES